MPGSKHPEPLLLAAPDKLKGTLRALPAAEALAACAVRAGWRVDSCPLSDGGEGFAEVLAGIGGEERTTSVTGPLGRRVEAVWRLAGSLAVLESAAASGLVLAGGADRNDPVRATSRGTGELVVAAVRAGARRVLVGVGGSATTDGGSGALEAIEEAGGRAALLGVDVVVACDVDACFVEAAALFGPQKGAGPADEALLSRRLEELAHSYRHTYGVDVSMLPGSGAAGGLAGGLAALGARLVPGFDLVARTVGLERRLAQAQLVVTAEGRLDASSWTGKVVGGVVAMARRLGVRAAVLAGTVEEEEAAKARRGGVEVIDLHGRFGDRTFREPAACLASALAAVL